MKILWKWAKRLTLVFLIFLAIGLIAIRSPYVQSKLVAYAGDRLGKHLGTTVQVGRVDLEFFRSLVLENLLIHDQRGDTLLYLDRLVCSVDRLKPQTGNYSFRDLELEGVLFDLKVREGQELTNMQFILDHIKPKDKDSTQQELLFRSDAIQIADLHFRFLDENKKDSTRGIHFSDLDVQHMDLIAQNFLFFKDTVSAQVEKLSLEEKSGFELVELLGRAEVSSKGLAIQRSQINTGNSQVNGDILFRYENYSAFKHFVDEVYMKCALDSSLIHSSDLAYFADALFGADMQLALSGKVRGTVNDLKARNLELGFGTDTEFRGDVDMTGLPDILETFMIIDVRHLQTTLADLETVNIPPFDQKKKIQLPKNLRQVGKMDYHGNFTGFLNDMVTFGTLATDIGRISTDMSFVRDTINGHFIYKGRFIADRFDLGKFYSNNNLGQLSCDLQVDAHGDEVSTLSANIEGSVGQLQFNQYDISSITVNGLFQKEHFTGALECKDPNLEFVFNGEADLSRSIPTLNFEANVFHADLHKLAIVKGIGYSSLTTRIGINAELDPSDPSGTLSLEDFSYCDDAEQYDLGDIHLGTSPHEKGKQFTLRSDIANATITGVYDAQKVKSAFRSIFYSVFPALASEVEYEQVDQVFELDLVTGESDRLMELIMPDLRIAPGSKLSGFMNTRTFDLEFDAYSAIVEWKGRELNGLELALHQTMEVLGASIKASKATLNDSLYVDDVLITAKGYQDEFDALLDWRGSGLGADGRFDIQGMVNGPNNVEIDLLPSHFNIKDQHWVTERPTNVKIDHNEIQIWGMEVRNGDQVMEVEGSISRDPEKSLKMNFENFDLSSFNVLLQDAGISIQGILEGEASVSNVYETPLLLSYLCVDSLGLNEKHLGYLTLAAVWKNEQKLIDVNGTLENNNIKALDLRGYVKPDGQNSTLDITADVSELDMAFLNAIIPDNITDIKALATGNLRLDGKVSDPQLSGSVFLKDGGLRIAELNTTYLFDHTLKIYPGTFAFDFMEIHDEQYREGEEGHKGVISGAINHIGFKEWNFDLFGDVVNLQGLNTTASMNELYYGTAYGTGDLNVFGYTDNLEIRVRARSEAGTNISLPLSSSTEVSMSDFIRFIDTGPQTTRLKEQRLDLSGITMELDLEVTPEAEFELIFDETVGDVIKGNGVGNIKMEIEPSGNFKMLGDFEIYEGDYLFTLKNILNKRFVMEKGGTIQWFGDPYQAQIDLNAVYKTRTSLYDIMYEKRDEYKQRVPVNVVMRLTHTLLDPYINFDIEVPTVSQEVRSQVDLAVNTDQELNRQVFAVIVLNKFLPPPNGVQTAQTTTGSITASTTSEMLSNQVSNWLSRISDDFDVGFNYRPGDEVTENEIEVALSTQLFNDRVALNTNLGYHYGETSYTQNPNALIGDFEVEYKITSEGRLRLKVFNVSNDQDLINLNQAPTTQGVGVFYQEDFDNWPELMCKFGNVFRGKKKKRDCGSRVP